MNITRYQIEGNITFFIKGDTIILENWHVGQNHNVFDVIGQPYLNDNFSKKEVVVKKGEGVHVLMSNQNLETLVLFTNTNGVVNWKQLSVSCDGVTENLG